MQGVIIFIVIFIASFLGWVLLFKKDMILNKFKTNIKTIEEEQEETLETTDIDLNHPIEVEICFKPNQEFLEAEIHNSY